MPKTSDLMDQVKRTQVWRSLFRHDIPRDERGRAQVVLTNIFLHLHTVRTPKSGIRVRYTRCMGGLTFFIFMVEVVTGIMLMFYYRPTLEYAYTDIIDLGEQVPLGIMRDIHRWGAHLMIITVWLHMLRVFMTGSYKPPREFNWAIGVILLLLTLMLSFTGYLLPWDQLAIWAITVGSNMARATPFLGHEGPGAAFLNEPGLRCAVLRRADPLGALGSYDQIAAFTQDVERAHHAFDGLVVSLVQRITRSARYHGLVSALTGHLSVLPYEPHVLQMAGDDLAEIHERQSPLIVCLLYTSPSPRDGLLARMPSSA